MSRPPSPRRPKRPEDTGRPHASGTPDPGAQPTAAPTHASNAPDVPGPATPPDAAAPSSREGGTGRAAGSGGPRTARRAAGTPRARGSRRTGPGESRLRVPRTPSRPVGARDAAELLGSREEPVSSGFAARLAERRRARWHLRGVRLAAVLLTFGVVAAGAWVTLFSPVLALSASSIDVSGQSGSLGADQIRAKVQPFVGTPLARLDTDAVSRAVDTLTPVSSSEVTRAWPTGVSVRVVLRTPALVVSDGDRFDVLDDRAVVLRTTDSRPTDLPLVTLPDSGDLRVAAAGAVTTMWSSLTKDLRGQVVSVGADGHTLTLTLSQNRTVVWGTSEDSALKARVLAVLMTQRPATTYDVSSPKRPVTS